METTENNIGKEVRESICRMMSEVRSDTGDTFVQLPIFYVTGSSAVARISRVAKSMAGEESRFIVDDAGSGYAESESLGVQRSFTFHGGQIANRIGAEFVDHKITISNISRDMLSWAVLAVANATSEAVTLVSQKVDEAQREQDTEILCRRLRAVFPTGDVVRGASIIGSSNTKWEVDAMLQWRGQKTVFDAVSKHHASIYAVATKLGDIKAMEDAPNRVVVVRKKSELSTYHNVLARIASVIERDAGESAYLKVASRGSV